MAVILRHAPEFGSFAANYCLVSKRSKYRKTKLVSSDENVSQCFPQIWCSACGLGLPNSTDLLMNSDHKPKLGQSDLLYWVYRLSCL